PEARLVATGAASGVPALIRAAPALTLSGYVPDIRAIVRGSRASIVPLRLGVGTRLKIMEAMALGTPVVATPLGAEGLDAADGEHLLIGDSPARFGEQVLRVLGSRDLRARLAAAGRRLVEERYAWEVIGATLRAALEGAHQQPAAARP
ncbi:MAG: glycosyltransferase, partial [Chloroflexales bacterium]|nr:glycosyltransferase [Chloroflexales bacterium]